MSQHSTGRATLDWLGCATFRLIRDDLVSVWPSLHSCIWTHASFTQPDQVCMGDLGVVHQDRLARLEARRDQRTALGDDVREHLRASQHGARGDGGALVYRFETPEGSLRYQDTCGHWSAAVERGAPDTELVEMGYCAAYPLFASN